MDESNRYYQSSGTIGAAGPILMILFGVIGTLILGAVYGYAVFYIPFIYLNFLITAIYGAGVGYLIGLGGKWGKVRNSGVLALFGFLFGCIAVYTGWVSWIFAVSEQTALAILPSNVWGVMTSLAEEGAWEIFGWAPSGAALFTIWGIEAFIIFGLSAGVAWAMLSSTPFCEHCKQWVETKHEIEPLSLVENPHELREQLEAGNFEMLKALKLLEVAPTTYSRIELLHCPGCQQNDFLTVESVEVTIDSDKTETKNENGIVQNLIITPEQIRMLKAHWQSGQAEIM